MNKLTKEQEMKLFHDLDMRTDHDGSARQAMEDYTDKEKIECYNAIFGE